MIEVGFKDALFRTHHGITELERRIGNQLLVSCSVQYPETKFILEQLETTVDYVRLYTMVDHQLQQSNLLLESLAVLIEQEVKREFYFITAFSIEMQKLNPPLNADVHCMVVKLDKKYA